MAEERGKSETMMRRKALPPKAVQPRKVGEPPKAKPTLGDEDHPIWGWMKLLLWLLFLALLAAPLWSAKDPPPERPDIEDILSGERY